MKKLFAIFLALAMITLAGCKDNTENTSFRRDNPPERTMMIESEESSDPPESSAPVDIGIDIPDVPPVIERAYLCTYKKYENDVLTYHSETYYDKYFNDIKTNVFNVETGEKKEDDGEYSYLYDDAGRIKVKFYGTIRNYKVYYYDENGYEIREEEYYDGELSKTKITDVNEQGDAIRSYYIHSLTTDEEIAKYLKKHTEYTYDKKRRTTFVECFDENDELKYELYFEYNDDKLTFNRECYYFFEEDEIINNYYEYEGEKHIRKSFHVDKDGKETLDYTETCEYNEYDRLAKLLRVNSDGSTRTEIYDYVPLAGGSAGQAG